MLVAIPGETFDLVSDKICDGWPPKENGVIISKYFPTALTL